MDEKNQKTKANTPVQGVESAGVSEEATSEKKVFVLPESTPDWLKELIASGQAIVVSSEDFEALAKSNEAVVISNEELIASNQKVIETFGTFQEKCIETFGTFQEKCIEILKSIKGAKSDSAEETAVVKEKLEVNPEAKYIVSKGRKFHDSKNAANIFTAGQDVTNIGVERLTVLLNQGFIEEADEEESDD